MPRQMDAHAINKDWLGRWRSLERGAPTVPTVPPSACAITTPLVPVSCRSLLHHYPFRSMSELFLRGITTGFRIGFQYPTGRLSSATRNLHSARDHPEVVQEYLRKEVAERRVMGPFPKGFISQPTSTVSGSSPNHTNLTLGAS